MPVIYHCARVHPGVLSFSIIFSFDISSFLCVSSPEFDTSFVSHFGELFGFSSCSLYSRAGILSFFRHVQEITDQTGNRVY